MAKPRCVLKTASDITHRALISVLICHIGAVCKDYRDNIEIIYVQMLLCVHIQFVYSYT